MKKPRHIPERNRCADDGCRSGKNYSAWVRPHDFLIGILLTLGILLMEGRLRAQEGFKAEQVVLLHGLARGPWSMKVLERRLSHAGYRVHNIAAHPCFHHEFKANGA